MAQRSEQTKKQWVAEEVAKAVRAGYPADLETVDFSDPNRPPTCAEVDFPILPINQIAAIEGNAGKPIYQMSKWWARRRSSVFRSLLIAAAAKAPDDPSEAAKLVWDHYYSNHQKNGRFGHLKVADIFMGGGTTVVEGSRLGVQMCGIDLNPVAWFVVKNEIAQLDEEEISGLLSAVEDEVKPQIMPFYACNCPRGHSGKWTHTATGEVMNGDFDPLSISPDKRRDYSYEGPEILYEFWAKHGPCSVTGCGHRTPVMSSPLVAVRKMTVKAWSHKCPSCGERYDIEDKQARMAPGVSLVVSEDIGPYAPLRGNSVKCPVCDHVERFPPPIANQKPKKKVVELAVLVHPDWLSGIAGADSNGTPYGGSVDSTVEATIAWNNARAANCNLIEFRGELPKEILCPSTGKRFSTQQGTKPKQGYFSCASCGSNNGYLKALESSETNGPIAAFAAQCYCPKCAEEGDAYGGKFFAPVQDASRLNAAMAEWSERREYDLSGYYPDCEIPYGERTHVKDPLPKHGFKKWSDLFNCRQLLVNSLFMKALDGISDRYGFDQALYIAGAVQQFLRYENMLCFWHRAKDHFAPALSNNNYNPKDVSIEVGPFCPTGYGPWRSVTGSLRESAEWRDNPWELLPNSILASRENEISSVISTKSVKVYPADPPSHTARLICGSSSNLDIETGTYDLVVTDPPFGGLLQYSELSDFFFCWLRRLRFLQGSPGFSLEDAPKALECVSNTVRHDDPEAHYRRMLTACYSEACRILKPGGLMAFTFHHSEDEPWVDVLEALFNSGFILEATYPIRGDETKGDNAQFGSQKIEYDIIHVCRKRTAEPTAVSWAKMRREVLQDVRQLRQLLEAHAAEGLPEADLQVIRRGKALEYFSKHYGKVYVDEDKPISVLEALAGINQLLDEEIGEAKDPPPVTAEPFTRQFLRLFDGIDSMPRDQIQKFLRGTGIAPSEFESRGWCVANKKVYHVTPVLDVAHGWIGKKRAKFTNDYEQAAFMVGACMEGSGINARDTLNNQNFKPHPALGGLLEWFATRNKQQPVRNAARMAQVLYKDWIAKHRDDMKQLELFFSEEEA